MRRSSNKSASKYGWGRRLLPVALAFCVATGLLCHAQINPNRVAQLRWYQADTAATMAVHAYPYAMAFDGSNIWVGSGDSSGVITKVRASDGAVLLSTALPNPTGYGSIAQIAYDGANIWASLGYNDVVAKVRASDGALLGTFPVGTDAYGLVFDGNYLWVSN